MKYLYDVTVNYKFLSSKLIAIKYFPIVKDAVMALLLKAKEYTE